MLSPLYLVMVMVILHENTYTFVEKFLFELLNATNSSSL